MRRLIVVALLVALGTTGSAPAARADRARSTGELLAAYVSSPANDRALRREVRAWHRTLRNGCVAYASTALRHVGVDIAEKGKLDGDGISRLTRGFSRHLEDNLGWTRVTDAATLRPGDLVFTVDVVPEYPAHVFVFHGWVDRRRAIARISDNTGHRKSRPMFPGAGSDIDPFAYALRAP